MNEWTKTGNIKPHEDVKQQECSFIAYAWQSQKKMLGEKNPDTKKYVLNNSYGVKKRQN